MTDIKSNNNSIKCFSQYFTNKLSKQIVEEISKFSKNYSEENEIPFLEQSIFDTKVNELEEAFRINKNLVKDIKKDNLNLNKLCTMKPEELQPERYMDILNKKKIEEHRKNNKATSDAFTCAKCKSKKSVISERQTRAGDEPATIFVTCVECSHVVS